FLAYVNGYTFQPVYSSANLPDLTILHTPINFNTLVGAAYEIFIPLSPSVHGRLFFRCGLSPSATVVKLRRRSYSSLFHLLHKICQGSHLSFGIFRAPFHQITAFLNLLLNHLSGSLELIKKSTLCLHSHLQFLESGI